ncbi:MAG TPA: DEAD/DEAH box helicase [Anaerolineaceae bacterium]|nr:DEAD/DEAH box helicase [Anaerolineaceae bacterium]
MQKIRLAKEPSTNAKHLSFSYQLEAVNAIKDLDFAAVFHEQGLGKTKIAIDIMLYWLSNKLVDTIIILTKKILINNWKEELANHTYLKPKVLSADRDKNYYVFNSPSRVILCNFELLVSEKERIKLFQKTRTVAIIIDESAKIKNPESIISKTLFEMADGFVKRIIMTGTPIANRPYDIWSQIYFLDYGKSLGTSFLDFKRTTDLTNELSLSIEKQNVFENNIKSIFKRIDSFSVRETKNGSIISLPDKEFHQVITQWEKHQLDLYKKIKNELQAFVIKDQLAVLDESENILKRLLRLVQVASNPKLIDDAYDYRPGKMDALESIINKIIEASEKGIIWTSFTKNVDWIAQYFSVYKAARIHGKMKIEERNQSILQFKNNDSVKILIATPAAAKEGLTLTIANHVIFYDRGFSLDDYLQAQDRIHRISQTKSCHIYNLIMEDSVDEWVDVLLNSKQTSAQLSQGDINLSEFKRKMDYSFGEIIQRILFSEGKEGNKE